MGDGINTFNLPDYRGRFLRGVDGTAGRDLDAASRSTASPGGNSGDMVGSVQGDQLTSHGHSVSLGYNSVAGNQYPFIAAIWSGELSHVVEPPSDNYVGFAGGSETRPKNVNVNYIIKY
jgi:microcystin-dependent protein